MGCSSCGKHKFNTGGSGKPSTRRSNTGKIFRTIDKKTGKVKDIYEDTKKYQILEHDTSIGELERRGASLEPSLAKRVRKKGGKVKTSKYSKGGGVRSSKYKL